MRLQIGVCRVVGVMSSAVTCLSASPRRLRDVAVSVVLMAAVAWSPGGSVAQDNADQDVSPNISASQRFAQNFETNGVRLGSFTALPIASFTQIYDDNIFSDEASSVDDFIADMRASLGVQSNWSVHELNVLGNVRRRQYYEQTSESTTDYSVAIEGALDLSQRAQVRATGGYARRTEPRRFLQTAFGDVPVRFSVYEAGLRFDVRGNRFAQQFGVSVRSDDFGDVLDPTTGAPIDQDFRDRDALNAFYRQLFRLRPAIALFGEVRGGVEEFGSAQIGIGEAQDSQTYAAAIGVAFDINKVARGEIGVGYQSRDFDSSIFTDIDGLNVDASLEYFVTDLTTITLNVDRSIRSTAVVGVAGFQSTSATVAVEHELLRTVLLSARAEYRDESFRDIDRTDEFLSFSAGVDYAFRRNVALSLSYRRVEADSDGVDARPGFTENLVRLGIELRR